jgi:hypothetical protein
LIKRLEENEHIYTEEQVKSFKEGIDKATDVLSAKMNDYSEYLQEANLKYNGAISDLLIMSDESLPGATTDQNPSENIFEPRPLTRNFSDNSLDSYNPLGLGPESPNTKKIMKRIEAENKERDQNFKEESEILRDIEQPKIVPSKAAKMKEEEKKKKKPKIGGKKTKSKKSKSKKNKTKKKNRKSKSKK